MHKTTGCCVLHRLGRRAGRQLRAVQSFGLLHVLHQLLLPPPLC